jgi:hypothetical protein
LTSSPPMADVIPAADDLRFATAAGG